MKKMIILMLAALSLASTAHADAQSVAFTLSEDAVSLMPIDGEVFSTQVYGFVFPEACPPNAMCMPASRATIDLNFTLMGCADELGPVTYTYERSEDRRTATVYVSAINVVSKRSAQVKCLIAKTEQRRIQIWMSAGLEDVEVKFLGSSASAN